MAYKLGWALAAYHLLQTILLIGVEDSRDARAAIQQGFWPLKVVVLLAMGVGALYLPNWLMVWLHLPTLILGIIFLLVQAILLVDLAYTWAEDMLERVEMGKNGWRELLIVLTLLLALSAIVIIVGIYLFFEQNQERTLITINAILLISMFICSVLPSVQDANSSSGIFQASLLGLYSLLMMVSAFISNPTRPRGPNDILISYPILSKLVAAFSVVFAYGTMAHAALSTGNNLHRMAPSPEDDSKGALDTEDEAFGRYNYSLFHLGFALAAFYTVLYVTFWQRAILEAGKMLIYDDTIAFWSRVVSSWVVAGLYLWSLFAPVILVERF